MAAIYRCSPDCSRCLGTGAVCSDHPRKAYLQGTCCRAEPNPCPSSARAFEPADLDIERERSALDTLLAEAVAR